MDVKKLLVGLAICLALAAGGALSPTPARAQHGRFQGQSVRAGQIIVGRSVGARPFVPHPFAPNPFLHLHRRFFRPSVPFGTGSLVAVYAPPPVYYNDAPPAYHAPPTYYGPSAGGTPGVIEYPAGRYELRGDGTTTPYVWVWIPNPPSAPPDAATQADLTPRVDNAMRRPSSPSDFTGPKIISIPSADVSPPPSDASGPKIISIPSPLR